MAKDARQRWAEANADKRRESQRKYKAANPEAVKITQRKLIAGRRQALQAIKLERGCADCGYADRPEALDFDHVRGEKSFSIGTGLGRPWESTLQEVEKCDVVCANCHRIRTADRRLHGKGTT